jgi:hypothetical protein
MKSNTQIKREKYQAGLLKNIIKIHKEDSELSIDKNNELQVAQTTFNLNIVIESYEQIKRYLNNSKRNKEKVYKAYVVHHNAIKAEIESLRIKGLRSLGLERIFLLDMNVSTNDIIRIQKIH